MLLGFMAKKMLNTSFHKTLKFHAFYSSSTAAAATAFESAIKSPKAPKPHEAFMISYLVNSCKFTEAEAKRMTKRRSFKSIEKPDRSLGFFKSCGFNQTQISSIMRKKPELLLADPDRILKPKFEALVSLGAPPDTAVKIISKSPTILVGSLKNMTCLFESLMRLLDCDVKKVLSYLSRWHFRSYAEAKPLERNAAILQEEFGLRDSVLSSILISNSPIFTASCSRLRKYADRALSMGFDVQKSTFGDAVQSFTGLTEENWKKKVEVYKKWGWSDTEFLAAFRKRPRIMLLSEANIDRTMDFMVNTVGLNASFVAKRPKMISYSLKKRMIPRWFVIQLLKAHGLLEEEDYNIASVFMCSEEEFLKEFLQTHDEMRSALYDLYSLRELN